MRLLQHTPIIFGICCLSGNPLFPRPPCRPPPLPTPVPLKEKYILQSGFHRFGEKLFTSYLLS